VKGMAAIFSYGFEIATENFKNANIDLYTLSNYENLLPLAVSKKYITEEEELALQNWRKNPSTWGK
jgi:orotate phosphoribosyltransferase